MKAHVTVLREIAASVLIFRQRIFLIFNTPMIHLCDDDDDQ